MRLIDADALYEKTAEWEAQALHMAEVTMHDEDKTEWRRWSAVLTERSAFKHDIADAPTIVEFEGDINKVIVKGEEYQRIVRCKDCIYFDKYTDCIEKYQWDGFCADWARNTYENWYCSRAERRSDETD